MWLSHRSRNRLQRLVVIAVVSMGMAQATFHQIVHVASLRCGLVSAIWTVIVLGIMSARPRGALFWIRLELTFRPSLRAHSRCVLEFAPARRKCNC